MPDSPMLILVVDDRVEVARSLATPLIAGGHRVELASGGFEGMSGFLRHQAAGDPVHLVCAAIDMVGMDGLGLLGTLRKRGTPRPEFALIASSGSPPIDVLSAARALGCDLVLTRPWKQEQIAEALRLAEARRSGHPVERTPDSGQPYFGTTRMLRSTRALPAAEEAAPPPREAGPAAAGGVVAPELLGDDPGSGGHRTGRERSSGGMRTLPDPAGAAPSSGAQRRAAPPADSSASTGALARPGAPRAQPPTAALRPPPAAPPADGGPPRPLPTTSTHRRPPADGAPPRPQPTTSVHRRPAPPPQGYQRTFSDPFLTPQAGAPGETTARIRRGVDGGRPDTGSHASDPPATVTRPVTCPLCGRPFQAPQRTAAFTTLCVHCGQLVRVAPE